MRIDRRRITRSVAKLAQTRRSLRRAAAGPAREATITQQAVTVLVPEHPAAGEKPAEPGASGDQALLTGELLVEEITIGPHPSAASPSSPAALPAGACDANPLAGFGSEASEDQHYVLDAAHTQRKG